MRFARLLLKVGLVCFAIGIAPIAWMLLVETMAKLGGCSTGLLDRTPCVVAGHDWRPSIANQAGFGWFLLLTIWPLLASPFLLVVGLVEQRRARRRGER